MGKRAAVAMHCAAVSPSNTMFFRIFLPWASTRGAIRRTGCASFKEMHRLLRDRYVTVANIPDERYESNASILATEMNASDERARVEIGLSTRDRAKPEVYMISVLILIAGLVIGFVAGSSIEEAPFTALPAPPSMGDCQAGTMTALNMKQPPTPETLREVVDYCYSSIYGQGLLNDFAVRELTYRQQYRTNHVLMWLVVGVAISGVLLAGVQLLTSYRLASALNLLPTSDSEIILRHNQVALKSSVTGLVILLISFAFFLIFVLYIYRFEKPEHQSGPPLVTAPTLPQGGLGPPKPSAVGP